MLIALLIGVLAAIGIPVWISRTRKNVASLVDGANFVHYVPDLGAMHLIERFGEPVQETISIAEDQKHQKDSIELPAKPVNQDEPSKPSSASNVNTSSTGSGYLSDDVKAAVEGAAQGALFSTSAIQNLMVIDEHTYIAMSTLAGEQLTTIGDLSSNLASWESAEIGEALPPAAVSKLMGHLSEPIVAENLRELGYQVELPDISNIEGYDLILNGDYFVNVKTVADAGSLSSHFNQYPQIPVIVPEDMTGIPEGAIYLNAENSIDQLEMAVHEGSERIVLVDPNYSHADMVEHTEAVSDGLLGNVDLAAGGIPVITLALSGWRELKLLHTHKTDLVHAAKNLGLDVTGTALGGAGGAIIGTAIFPGVGTVVGAVLCGSAGRVISNKFKSRKLKKALENYGKKYEENTEKIRLLQEDSHKRFQSSVQIQTDELALFAERCKRELESRCSDVVHQRRNTYRISTDQALDLLNSSLAELTNRLLVLKRILRWNGMILGRDLRHRLRAQITQLDQYVRHVESEAVNIIEASPEIDLSGERLIRFLQIMLQTEEGIIQVKRILQSFEEQREELEENWGKYITEQKNQLALRRYQCMKYLSDTIQELNKEVSQGIRELREQLEIELQKVKTEKGRLGLGE